MTSGDTIGPYRLLAPIGKGAMGEVWRARDQRLDRLVALKLLPPDVAGDPERRARMLREARAAAAVPHPNVVTLFDIVEAGGCDVLVMELVEGETVAEALRARGAPPLERGLSWLIAIADALATAHARKILHRDIKAANVMVTRDGTVKVLDFGLAKLVPMVGPEVTDPEMRALPLGDGDVGDTVPATGTTDLKDVALDATVASEPGAMTRPGTGTGTGLDAYATRAGSLLGTPMYMAPEQLSGGVPDERTEVFSLGVLAHEVVSGKPPYRARTLDDLFAEISAGEPARLGPPVPDEVAEVIARALRHDREARYPTMAALRDALIAARDRLFRPRAARWPVALAALLAIGALAAGTIWWVRRPPPPRKGDAYVTRALDEYDVFYGDKALSSLRAALRVDPSHARALAYMILFGGTDGDRADALTRARAIADRLPAGKDRALLAATIVLEERGPAAAREALAAAAGGDYELSFWAAELAYRAGDFAVALPIYRELHRTATRRFRGRIFDHYSSVLIWADEPAAAVEVGARYHDAYPGEPDAVGVHATTLAVAGQLDRAAELAEEAVTLSRSEDTLAGLAKVRALRGELDVARQLYAESLAMAPPARRPLRRAALALLAWMQGDAATADAAVAPCLPGGADAGVPQRAACLAVAGLIAASDDPRVDAVATELDALAAAATPTRPAYGNPSALAALVRAHRRFAAGGCVGPRPAALVAPADVAATERALAQPLDFPSAYHVPFFATWAVCERAWLARAAGDRDAAVALLAGAAGRAPGRWWLVDDLAALRDTAAGP